MKNNNKHNHSILIKSLLFALILIISIKFSHGANTNKCNNGTLDPGEECDLTNFNGAQCSDSAYLKTFVYNGVSYILRSTGGNLACSSDCKIDSSGCIYPYPRCGDNHIDCSDYNNCVDYANSPLINQPENLPYCNSLLESNCKLEEQCDNGSLNGIVFTPPYGQNGTYCDKNCKLVPVVGPYCGDGNCDAGETASNCFIDCVNGWTTKDDTWSLSNGGYLQTKGANGVIYSDYVDLKANTNYTLSAVANIFNPADKIVISLDNTCINSSMMQGPCGISVQQIVFNSVGPTSNSTTINIPFSNNVFNGVYYRNVRLKISSTTDCPSQCANSCNSFIATPGYADCLNGCIAGCSNSPTATISNISLKETVMSGVVYSSLPSADQLSGCCPLGYCWDGDKCANGNDWMTDSQKTPVWNNILNSQYYKWNNSHVNTSYQSLAKGYRCVIADNNTGEAQWAASNIKYDWNYNASGYCARETDCFVSSIFDASTSGYSKGCIKDGDLISDALIPGEGNHYCHEGGWTTKSYIVATLLQNISTAAGYPYVLQCYDNTSINYNTQLDFNGILSSCVLVQKIDQNTEHVITGVVLDNDGLAVKFLGALISEYKDMHNIADHVFLADCIANPSFVQNSNFSTCVDVQNLKIYYEHNYHYFLISDQSIDGLSSKTMWQSISGFFKKLFESLFGTTPASIAPYVAINQTTSYDKVYILRNNNLNVTASEEAKYDEGTQTIVNILFVDYYGSNQTNNPINNPEIFRKINSPIVQGSLLQINCTGCLNSTYNSNYPGLNQQILIKTDKSTGVWRYLTSILRDRP